MPTPPAVHRMTRSKHTGRRGAGRAECSGERAAAMRFRTQTPWMPTLRRAGISAPQGWSAPIGYVVVVDGVRPMALTLKEGET